MAIVTDRQVKRLHALLNSETPLLVAAMRVDMDRKTARKYRDLAKLPSELETWPRTWRTREDRFADVWDEVREQLRFRGHQTDLPTARALATMCFADTR